MAVATLSPDSQTIALLCSSLALGDNRSVKPLTPSDWSGLAATIHNSSLKRPSALLGLGAEEVKDALSLDTAAASRVVDLLSRGGQLALELERLGSRGIWLVTRADDEYPTAVKERLRRTAPPILFGSGRAEILTQRAIAVVGSRDADSDSTEFATVLGRRIAADGAAVVSGAARGIDSTAMLAAVDSGGSAIGVVADALEKAVRRQDLRVHLSEGAIVLLSAYHPAAPFTVGQAMRRNRLIYCLSEAAIVVASGDTGGTWAGAVENLKGGWVPLYVRAEGDAPGNSALIREGGAPITRNDLDADDFVSSLAERAPRAQLSVESTASVSGPSETRARGEATEAPAEDDATLDAPGAGPTDAFELVWPSVAAFLATPHQEREVADAFMLELGQARAWLKRAVADGLAEVHGKPRRFLVTTTAATLFDDA